MAVYGVVRSGECRRGRLGERLLMADQRPLAGQQLSDSGLLRHLEHVIYLDTKVSNDALELRMAQE
ncbi:hypothetical protein DR64_8511 [Paraburkholderia xenovorans LB400]|nr:hypothetical protein DR64_8511 [Paraburkholderia xenovorans LB400]